MKFVPSLVKLTQKHTAAPIFIFEEKDYKLYKVLFGLTESVW